MVVDISETYGGNLLRRVDVYALVIVLHKKIVVVERSIHIMISMHASRNVVFSTVEVFGCSLLTEHGIHDA